LIVAGNPTPRVSSLINASRSRRFPRQRIQPILICVHRRASACICV